MRTNMIPNIYDYNLYVSFVIFYIYLSSLYHSRQL